MIEAIAAPKTAADAVLWKVREPLYDLMKHRATIGAAAFDAEKQGNPIDPSLCEWPSEYLDHPALYFDQWPERLEVKVLSLDPSKGNDAKTGDYSAFIRLGIQATKAGPPLLYADADLQRRDTDRIVADAMKHLVEFKPQVLALEENAFQSLFRTLIEAALAKEKITVQIVGLNNTVNKLVRIRRLTPYLSQRRFRIKRRSPGAALLVSQMQQFPVGDHDDGPDALEMAVREAVKVWNVTT